MLTKELIEEWYDSEKNIIYLFQNHQGELILALNDGTIDITYIFSFGSLSIDNRTEINNWRYVSENVEEIYFKNIQELEDFLLDIIFNIRNVCKKRHFEFKINDSYENIKETMNELMNNDILSIHLKECGEINKNKEFELNKYKVLSLIELFVRKILSFE